MNVIVAMMMCHYNIPKMYGEFAGQDPQVFGRVIFLSIGFSGLCAAVLGIGGLLRFGSDMPPGNILGTFQHDFPPEGMMNNTERSITLIMYLASALNIAATFPLLFFAAQAIHVAALRQVGKRPWCVAIHSDNNSIVGLYSVPWLSGAASDICPQGEGCNLWHVHGLYLSW